MSTHRVYALVQIPRNAPSDIAEIVRCFADEVGWTDPSVSERLLIETLHFCSTEEDLWKYSSAFMKELD